MRNRNGFSLVEILIVIALIVLLLAMALPAFNFITGGRSVDGALNQINAMLARARTEAVGIQEPRGVMFYIDTKTDRVTMVLVKSTEPKSTDLSNVDVYLDASDEDHIALPKGVGLQLPNTLSDSGGGVRSTDGYLGFNPYTLSNGDGSPGSAIKTTPTGGVVLFDSFGKLASLSYGFRMLDTNGKPTSMAKLVDPDGNFSTPPNDFRPVPASLARPKPGDPPVTASSPRNSSSLGLVLFDDETLKTVEGDEYRLDAQFRTNGPTYAPVTASPPQGSEPHEEKWLDDNGLAVMINRYNGTLLKGE